MQLAQEFESPILESFRNLDTCQIVVDLFVQFRGAHRFLAAIAVLASGAVIVGIMEENGTAHFLDGRMAAGTCAAIVVGKLETARAADELVFFLRRHHRSAFSATDKTCEGEFETRFRPWVAIPAQQYLHPVIFSLGNHGFVLSIIPLATAMRIFESAVIKWFGEELIDGASSEETVRRDELQEKIRMRVACVFEENDSSRNLDAFWHD